MNCPRCGAPGGGNFCSSCGASLVAPECPSCGHTSQAGARFCNQCGGSLAAGAAPGQAARPVAAGERPTANLGWWIAGALMAGLILVVAWPIYGPGGQDSPPGPAQGGGNLGASSVDLSSMTPREAADRLFNRVMTAVSQGNQGEILSFLPMAIAAYERAVPLDPDGSHHLSTLLRQAERNDEALTVATEALEANPDHLLLLFSAADAAAALGDDEAAGRYYQHLLDVWDDEMAVGRTEYQLHDQLMPSIRSTAEEFLSGG